MICGSATEKMRTSDFRRRTSAGLRGRCMRRPRGARVARRLKSEVTDRGSGTLAASALARHSEATRVSHDALGRPVSTADSESAARTWTYNERSEMTGCTSSDGSYSYFYDSIGNRTSSSSTSSNLVSVTHSYTANGLNQYDYVDSTALTYDADGNLTGDGRYSYAYDCENRLVSVTPILPSAGALAVENAYDHRSRRVRKTVRRYDGSAWQLERSHTFVWDDWNIVLERMENADLTTRIVEYYWGNDLSGTEQGAGGVGGLLAVSCDGKFYIPLYDGNGNIREYVDSSGELAAKFAYAPFGNVVSIEGDLPEPMMGDPQPADRTGLHGREFSFGFSTKYHDREVGLVVYQLRSYSPVLGRWLNRDPIEEDGGVNLYGFVKNNTICHVDIIGLYTMADAEKSLKAKGVLKGGTLGLFYSEMQLFSEWLSLERTRGSWWSVLPKCPKRICISKSGKPINPDPAIWQDPEPLGLNKINHPGGTFEMRSKPIGHYANQCIYDAAGVLMTRPPAAGTVDYYSTSGYLSEHFFHDLRPFHYSRNLRRIPDYYSVRLSW